MRQWKLMAGRDCNELRMAWVMTYLLPVIATRQFSPRLRTSDNGNRVTDRWRHENIKWDLWKKDIPEKQQA